MSNVHPAKIEEAVWPHWDEGVPTRLCTEVYSPGFYLGEVYREPQTLYQSLELKWRGRLRLSLLRSRKHRHLLPNKSSGVYRIFAPETAIRRFCGEDPTGTLYLGRSGSEGRSWSNLRTRIKAIATDHHATKIWNFGSGSSGVVAEKYPWESLEVEWAYTIGEIEDHKGEKHSESKLAEGWLLDCYHDSYGEYPPLNQRR